MRGRTGGIAWTTLVIGVACQAGGQTNVEFHALVDSLAAEAATQVEAAVGLSFRYEPNVAVQTQEQVRDYVLRKMATEVPDEEIEQISTAYTLFHLLPEDLDLRGLFVDLYTEQIVGFYDPGTDTLYVVEGVDESLLSVTVGHELVHALQAQHFPIDSLLSARGDNDRRLTAQAVLEGQGMVASMVAMFPDRRVEDIPDFWRLARETVRQQQSSMPVLGSAPLILREELIFPYLYGGDFVSWFTRQYPDRQPFGDALPASTEQIMHPERFVQGDVPVRLRYGDEARYQDGLGEFEMRVLFTVLTGSESTASATVRDWDGDRYAVYPVQGEHGLVWWTVWDTPRAADRFRQVLEREWPKKLGVGRDYAIVTDSLGGQAAVGLVDGPIGWEMLAAPPRPVTGA